ncbi:uncharacterized protein I206_102844 [Kwoniella pini CBS 10737]|uniref:Uncharacterized protein n=1 Tax=Kwoniella pini CBS 10737 TaxID=1296096 RepID=A0A1B9I6M2_9TREE|nr:uncharacterized protein I206_03197 [Kwoniella pini CBS 10737]OCF51131.1 hypothetical protein I206_03197 [Kwoniella pini CBS 10737]
MAKEPPTSTQKRAAPISASAFAFSISTPQKKKPKPSTTVTAPLSSLQGSNQTPHVKKEWASPALPRFAVPEISSPSQTPLRTLNQDEEEDQPIKSSITPRKVPILRPLNALTTPFTPLHKSGDPGPSTTSKTLRRLNERAHDVTPLKDKIKEIEGDSKLKFALHETLLSDQTKGDLFSKRKATLIEDDEGIGVSPRGKRIAKWSGSGAIPPSIQLANLLSSSNASINLFYTSMQHLLYPSQRAGSSLLKPRMAINENISSAISPLQYIESAANIRMKILQPCQTPTHNSIIFWCESIKWNDSTPPENLVPVIFQPLPTECPKLGVDPKLLAMKMKDDAAKTWQVGIWAWTEIDMPISCIQGQMVNDNKMNGDILKANYVKSVRALIVTRYLIVGM